MNLLGGLLFSAALLAIAAVIVYQHTRPSPVPRGWTHTGPKPPGADRALELLRPLCPGMRWGGTVVWRTAPWPAGYDDPPVLVGGQVLDMEAHRIACLDLTRLPHEIDHLRRQSYEEGTDGWVVRAEAAVRGLFPPVAP